MTIEIKLGGEVGLQMVKIRDFWQRQKLWYPIIQKRALEFL